MGDMSEDFELHFDLYNKKTSKQDPNDLDINAFAPFSHDAETVPEPGSLLLFGIGMVGLAGARRKWFS